MWEGVARTSRASLPRASLAARVRRALGQAAGTAASSVSLARMLGEQGLKKLGIGGGDGISLPFLECPARAHGTANSEACLCVLRAAARRAEVLRETVGREGERPTARDTGHRDRPLSAGAWQAPPARHWSPRCRSRSRTRAAATRSQSSSFRSARPARVRRRAWPTSSGRRRRSRGVMQRATSETVMLYTTLVHGLPALLEKVGVKRGPEGEQSHRVESVRTAREALPDGRGRSNSCCPFLSSRPGRC